MAREKHRLRIDSEVATRRHSSARQGLRSLCGLGSPSWSLSLAQLLPASLRRVQLLLVSCVASLVWVHFATHTPKVFQNVFVRTLACRLWLEPISFSKRPQKTHQKSLRTLKLGARHLEKTPPLEPRRSGARSWGHKHEFPKILMRNPHFHAPRDSKF